MLTKQCGLFKLILGLDLSQGEQMSDREPLDDLQALADSQAEDMATRESKAVIFFFLLFTGIAAFVDGQGLGWWWIPYLLVGMFAVSMLYAWPFHMLKRGVAGSWSLGVPVSLIKLSLPLLDIAGYVLLWFVCRELLTWVAELAPH